MILNLPTSEPYPALEGTEAGTILICGGAACVWEDIVNYGGYHWMDHHVMTVNDITMHFPGEVQHAYSNAGWQIERWWLARRDTLDDEYGPIPNVHAANANTQHGLGMVPVWLWPWPGHGSSGLGAVYTALALGYDRVILCGIPMDNSPHYFDPPWIGSKLGNERWSVWENAAKNVFDGKVTSMSGRTRELLGSPALDRQER